MRNIDFSILNEAQLFYSDKGFNNVRAPWRIPADICEKVSGYKKEMVGSAEQSLFYLRSQEILKDNVLYQSVTPCFRYEEVEDETHWKEFIKLELICFNPTLTIHKMVDIAAEFFRKYSDKVKLIETNEGFDLEINKIEVGSYYQKNIEGIKYICGTGVALPRFQEALKLGYSNSPIKKEQNGTVGKLKEEFEEYIDAVKQGNILMALVELSDLLGAIDSYANRYNMDLDKLIKMSKTTQRAFKEGKR